MPETTAETATAPATTPSGPPAAQARDSRSGTEGAGALPEITLLMAVYNGAAHLPAQLASFCAQQGVRWRLIVGEDGSQDDSPALLAAFARHHPLELRPGPGQGATRNFLQLLADSPPGQLVALADQDDVWLPDKLARAAHRLAALPPGLPALYCSRRIDWQPEGDRCRASRPCPRPAGFGNALVENIAYGNTIVLNAAAAALARETCAQAKDVPFHDWWLYLLVTGCGGRVLHDPEPGLLYRQHAGNLVGAARGWRRRLARELTWELTWGDVAARAVEGQTLGGQPLDGKAGHPGHPPNDPLSGNLAGALEGAEGHRAPAPPAPAPDSYRDRIGRNLAALEALGPRLSPAAHRQLAAFRAARAAPLPARLWRMARCGIYRQHPGDGLQFWGALCLGRV